MNKLFIRGVAILGIATFILAFKDIRVYKSNYLSQRDLVAKSSESILKQVSREEILSYFDKDEAIVYIGSSSESHKVILDLLENLSKEYNIGDYVFYDSTKESPILSLKTERSYKVDRKPTSFYYSLLDKVGPFACDYNVFNSRNEAIKTDYKIIVDPTVFFIKKGKIIFSYFIKDANLSDKELENIRNIYIQGFELVKS